MRVYRVWRCAKSLTVAVFAVLLGACGGDDGGPETSGDGSGTAAAVGSYFSASGIEYVFEYQLDAYGRVANYQILPKEGTKTLLDYIKCEGSLQKEYTCETSGESDSYSWAKITATMVGSPVTLFVTRIQVLGPAPPPWTLSIGYRFGAQGLINYGRTEEVRFHGYNSEGSTLTYGTSGRLATVFDEVRSNYTTGNSRVTLTIATDSLGRLLSGYGVGTRVEPQDMNAKFEVAKRWEYAPQGFLRQEISEMSGYFYAPPSYGLQQRTTTSYAADEFGWLTSRIVTVEDFSSSGTVESPVKTTTDSYSITWSNGRVEEERFTVVHPRDFYGWLFPGSVRYHPDYMPTKPLFVPRALTGTKGADYLGIFSSHQH